MSKGEKIPHILWAASLYGSLSALAKPSLYVTTSSQEKKKQISADSTF